MDKIKDSIKLKPVTKSNFYFLYELLKSRESRANISHKKMPTYEQHVQFVLSKPYSKWYIIIHNGTKSGSIYLTKQNEIGIFIIKEIQGKNFGNRALELLIKKNPRSRYLANVTPKNKKLIRFFQNNGFKLIQYTYELKNLTKR